MQADFLELLAETIGTPLLDAHGLGQPHHTGTAELSVIAFTVFLDGVSKTQPLVMNTLGQVSFD